jgi:peptide/nickel transport system permease protein
MFKHPWLPLVPGIPLVLVSLAFNFVGDGLRDALDPRLKR